MNYIQINFLLKWEKFFMKIKVTWVSFNLLKMKLINKNIKKKKEW